MNKTTNVLSVDIGRGNYAVCALTLSSGPHSVEVKRVELWRLGETKAMPASRLIDRLLDLFHNWDFWTMNADWVPSTVLIEQQVRGAHINLALAFATYTYFSVKFPTTTTVKFVSPSLKFKGFRNFVLPPQHERKCTNLTYAQRKKLAVELAEHVLEQTGNLPLCTLCPGAKKDDIADAFLQSFCV